MIRLAEMIVDALLDRPTPNGQLVKVKTPKGVITCDWNGYYIFGDKIMHSVGYPTAKGWSHGMLHPGDKILTQVPSPEEWTKSIKSLDTN